MNCLKLHQNRGMVVRLNIQSQKISRRSWMNNSNCSRKKRATIEVNSCHTSRRVLVKLTLLDTRHHDALPSLPRHSELIVVDLMLSLSLSLLVFFAAFAAIMVASLRCSSTQKYNGFHIVVIFHAAINPQNQHWESVLREQLSDVVYCGLVNVTTEFHVSLTIGKSEPFELSSENTLDLGEDIIRDVLRDYIQVVAIHRCPLNTYEYPSIRLLKRLAHDYNDEDNALFLYFHCKGYVSVSYT